MPPPPGSLPDIIVILPECHLVRSLLLWSLPYIPTPHVGSLTQSGLYVYICTCLCTRVGLFANLSTGKSQLPKQAHEHPETKSSIFHPPVSPLPPDGQGGRGWGGGGGMNPAPDEPLIPPTTHSQQSEPGSCRMDRWTDDQQSVLSKVPLTDGFRLPD